MGPCGPTGASCVRTLRCDAFDENLDQVASVGRAGFERNLDEIPGQGSNPAVAWPRAENDGIELPA